MRRSESVLTQREVVWLNNDAPEAVLSYLRTSGNGKILTVLNLTGNPVNVKLPGLAETFKPLLAEGAKRNGDGGFALEANGYFVGKK